VTASSAADRGRQSSVSFDQNKGYRGGAGRRSRRFLKIGGGCSTAGGTTGDGTHNDHQVARLTKMAAVVTFAMNGA